MLTASANAPPKGRSVVLVGLENVGKSALFRGLTGGRSGAEGNFRGSSVTARAARVQDLEGDLVDTPGLRLRSDSEAGNLALSQIVKGDALVLVVRSTDARRELELLLKTLNLNGRRLCIVFTFADKTAAEGPPLLHYCEQTLGVPAIHIDARELKTAERSKVIDLIERSRPLRSILRDHEAEQHWQAVRIIAPQTTALEKRGSGPLVALACLITMFAMPVYLAFYLSGWLQPLVDEAIIAPLTAKLANTPELAQQVLVGSYGVISLGWYSFVWAFPVVLLMGLAVAIGEETGIKDRICAALDPLMRRIGLSGQDLIPVLSGFGCNVVAVFQSRACSACTRRSCISMIAFGSACSYQIGATLSLFNVAGYPQLFIPYILLLFFTAAIHTRIWNGVLPHSDQEPMSERAFLQRPRLSAVTWRLMASLRQFLVQAMPIFLITCVCAALLQWFGLLQSLGQWVKPVMSLLGLPSEAAPGLIFSLLRKDGLLVLNHDGGSLLQSLGPAQVFLLTWVASTLSACLVTLWTIKREIGTWFALQLAGRQALSSLVVGCMIALLTRS